MSSVGGLDVLEVALVVVVGGADQRLPEPRQHEDRPPAAGGGDRARHHRQRRARDDDVRAAAGPDDRHLGLVVQLAGPQPVGPHAGGVDDVGGADLELLAARASRTRAPTARPPSSSSPSASTPLTATAPKRSASASTVSTSRDVVGLAVVEEVAAGRLPRPASAGSSSATSSPPITRWRAGLQSRPRAPRRRQRRQPVDRHHVVHVQPEPDQPVRPRAVEGGHDQRQRLAPGAARARR